MDRQTGILTIGELDPLGNRGITADRSCLLGLGFEPVTIVSSIDLGENEFVDIAPETLDRQLQAFAALDFRGVKTGLIGTRRNIETVASFFEDRDMSGRRFVADAILTADDRSELSSSAISLLKMRLLPLADLVIVYSSEAARLAGIELDGPESVKEAAEALNVFGATSVFIRADQALNGELVDVLYDGDQYHVARRKPEPAKMRVSRDVFACATLAYLIQGRPVLEAIQLGQKYERGLTSADSHKPA